MAVNMAANRNLELVLRALQLLFAIIVMATDGYAIHIFRGHKSLTHTPEGDFYMYYGVPNAWGFLMFCAGWTVLVVIFQLIAGVVFGDSVWIDYIRVAVEVIALLSWFAGFIAVAVNIGTDACTEGYKSCDSLTAATVFGALEWLLFVATTIIAVSLFLNSTRRSRASKT